MNSDKLCWHIHTLTCHSPFPNNRLVPCSREGRGKDKQHHEEVSKQQIVPQQLHHALWCLDENNFTLMKIPNHSHKAWICGPMLASVGVSQVVETQQICLIGRIFWRHAFLYFQKKKMKKYMILPCVTSNMLTRKWPFPREGSSSLVSVAWIIMR